MKAKIALAIAVAALAAAALIPAGLASPSKGSSATIGVQRTKLGRILVDGRGHTLYLFEKDKRGKSSCTGQCASYWPPLIASAQPLAAAGAKASLLGTTKRADGRLQVTYNHHPLYTFVKDVRKGQTSGEEVNAFGAEWYAVSAAGAKIEKNDAMSNSGDDPSSGYGGYGGY